MRKIKKLLADDTIILILLIIDKTIINLSYEDQVFWPVYITIKNLDAKTYWSQNWLATLFLGLIPIVYKQTKDLNNKNIDLKAKIYHLVLKTILQYI